MADLVSTLTLTEVESAIRGILLNGTSYSREGFSLTKAQLPALMTLRKQLISEAARASTTGVSFVSDFSGGPTASDALNYDNPNYP